MTSVVSVVSISLAEVKRKSMACVDSRIGLMNRETLRVEVAFPTLPPPQDHDRPPALARNLHPRAATQYAVGPPAVYPHLL